MCGSNCQPCQRCQQPNTSSRISASGVKDADFVESFLRRWHSRSCFRIDGQKIYREPKGKIVRKMFKYRLYPTRPQTEALMVQLSEACRLYNAALQERIEAYRTHHKSINYYDQAAQLTEIRKSRRPRSSQLPLWSRCAEALRESIQGVFSTHQARTEARVSSLQIVSSLR